MDRMNIIVKKAMLEVLEELYCRLDDMETVVVEAVKAAGLEVLEVTHQGEWVSVTARKN